MHPLKANVKADSVFFLQLPQLDNDVEGAHENVPLAAAYLEHAAERAGENRHYRFERIPGEMENADTPALAGFLAAREPAVLAFSLYLWNIERSLRLARAVKRLSPATRVVVGGPEVAYRHPFLFRAGVADAVVVGEGELAFPALLKAYRSGAAVNMNTVAVHTRDGYRWGRRLAPEVELADAIPPPDHDACRPDVGGMAYLETARGCPYRCTYCRYPHLRRHMTFLTPADIITRVRALRAAGAREIRFVDPTFNAHPRFRDVVSALASVNRDRRLGFFVELAAEGLTEADADALASANVAEIEVGLQSRDAQVLRAIRRPTDLAALERGVRLLTRRGIRVTLDIMYGLPLQRVGEVRASLRWAAGMRGVNVQCLQTLLLPGTELRDRHREWGVLADSHPPYGVQATSTMAPADFSRVEAIIEDDPRLRSDVRTRRFVGRRLPDLFPERVRVELAAWRPGQRIGGSQNRRAVIVAGNGLFGQRERLASLIRHAVRQDPDMLWQFVLEPREEEPLDLFDALADVIRRIPPHITDRYAAARLHGGMAARRLLVQLPPARRFGKDWVEAVEDLLGRVFF